MKLAIEKVVGSYKEKYNKIYEYPGEVGHSNLGTTTICKLGNRLFVRMYGHYQGYILVVVGIYANDSIYPIFVATIEAETCDSWCWFLQLLAEDLGIVNSHHVRFMSAKEAARTTIVRDHEKVIVEMRRISEDAHNWL
ncbi:hypothetical protein V6N13_106939 [Hibiscus sabdariffa]